MENKGFDFYWCQHRILLFCKMCKDDRKSANLQSWNIFCFQTHLPQGNRLRKADEGPEEGAGPGHGRQVQNRLREADKGPEEGAGPGQGTSCAAT